MANKKTILFVGNYDRRDYLDMLSKSKGDFNFFFLEYASMKEVKNNHYKSYGECIFWKDYYNAFDLIDKIKPVKVLFLSIEAYNHVALNVACKSLSIKTYILDHGVRNRKFNEVFEQTQPKLRLIDKLVNKLYQKVSPLDRLKTRLFFTNTVKASSNEHKAFLRKYFAIRKKSTVLETMQLIQSPLRLPDEYLSFSPFVYEWHKKVNNLSADQKVSFIGTPYFDHLVNVKPSTGAENNVLFVDQAFVTQRILGWTPNAKLQFNKELAAFCEIHKLELIVKEHPLEKSSMWGDIQSPNLHIDNNTPIERLAASVQVVIGFYSTLLLGLAALPHITLLTYEGHPAGNFSLSDFLTSRGVSKAFNRLEELDAIFPNLAGIHAAQTSSKGSFIKECLYKVDGQSGERLKNHLIK